MNLIYWIAFLPFLNCFLLLFFSIFFSKKNVGLLGIFYFLTFMFSVYIGYYYYSFFRNSEYICIPLWKWMTVNNYNIQFGFLIDSLSLSMLNMVTFISFWVYFFSFWYMNHDKEFIKYFLYMNVFIFFMLVLLLSDNLILLFLSWEAIGICSYLLIGFYRYNMKNGISAMKSFLMTRFGDIFLLLSIFNFFKFHTVNFHTLNYIINNQKIFYQKDYFLFFSTLFIVIGIIGKSAQIPLNTWLTEAMVGPTPTSALLHSTTIVISGIYLILRVYPLFLSNLYIMYFLAILGSFTVLIASFNAIFENDIKCILAYSTMSQIGYMFLALGTCNPVGAIIHLISHAFFKSLLFLSAGSIIRYMNSEKNILKMSGNLYKKIPLVYYSFLIGCASLISLPFVTSSFYSKGNILYSLHYNHHIEFLIIGFFGIFLTSIYTSRMFLLIFHNNNTCVLSSVRFNVFHNLPLIILSFFCTPLVWYFISHYCFSLYIYKKINLFSRFYIELFSILFSFLGLFCTYCFFSKKIKNYIFVRTLLSLQKNFSLDKLYEFVFIELFLKIVFLLSNDPLSYIIDIFSDIFFYLMNYKLKLEYKNVLWHIKLFIICWSSIVLLLLLM
ncbi:NADH dehydrogenase I chain L [Buchnera aphidicola (Cinara tujafilina)]|uniref:NADH dehydrogenase I chain L n=1 Tax=Buchnera aphidicola (Cinara tujafilina) TaxID=261317 RepID=F7WZ50_9GAMM|nr:NADH-quinone oxidoreductase subunit L [Buchnera aphidicola]AEH39702.1 NADH dehydrogenase I chain L [Buchnera aphidicola (Cinara tujafilina)]